MLVSVLVWLERFAHGRFAHGRLLASLVPGGGKEFLTIDWSAHPEKTTR
jgi:hypothetical protein